MKTRFTFLAFLAAATLLGVLLQAKDIWEESKPFTEWSKNEAVSVLRDSPWVKQENIQDSLPPPVPGGPVGLPPREGSGTPGGAGNFPGGPAPGGQSSENLSRTYSIVFLSASPVRKAFARLAMLNGNINEQQATQFVDQGYFARQIVVSVSTNSLQGVSELNQLSTDDLKEETYLELEESERKIYPDKYVPPNESQTGEALFFFPRLKQGKQVVAVSEKEVRFRSEINSRTKLEKTFKLKDMLVNGQLEI